MAEAFRHGCDQASDHSPGRTYHTYREKLLQGHPRSQIAHLGMANEGGCENLGSSPQMAEGFRHGCDQASDHSPGPTYRTYQEKLLHLHLGRGLEHVGMVSGDRCGKLGPSPPMAEAFRHQQDGAGGRSPAHT